MNAVTPFHPSSDVADEVDLPVGERHYPEFRALLSSERAAILADLDSTRQGLRETEPAASDVLDRAAAEAERSTTLRARDRQRKLLQRVDAALRRIEDGTYGECVVTGEMMTLGRMRARPVATMCVEAQEAHERRERTSRL